MWVRKSDLELSAPPAKARLELLAPIAVGVVLFGLGLLYIFGAVPPSTRRLGYHHHPPPTSVGEALPQMLVLVFIVFVAVYVVRLMSAAWYRKRRHQAFICPDCTSVYTDGVTNKCGCGTLLEPLSGWRWQAEATGDAGRKVGASG